MGRLGQIFLNRRKRSVFSVFSEGGGEKGKRTTFLYEVWNTVSFLYRMRELKDEALSFGCSNEQIFVESGMVLCGES